MKLLQRWESSDTLIRALRTLCASDHDKMQKLISAIINALISR